VAKTAIPWATHTWNPIAGCTKVSPACDNCYALAMSWRIQNNPKHPARYDGVCEKVDSEVCWTGRINVDGSAIDEARLWRKRRIVFVCSMSDLFHPGVADEVIEDIFYHMTTFIRHTFLVLTKRPERMARLVPDLWEGLAFDDLYTPAPNIWLGVTAENQEMADERIPTLLRIPAAGHFVSLEPMLSSIDLTPYLPCPTCGGGGEMGPGSGDAAWYPGRPCRDCDGDEPALDFVIAGGETGPGARPAHPDWFRQARDQCAEAGVPFMFKQHGEWLHHSQVASTSPASRRVFIDQGDGNWAWVPAFMQMEPHAWTKGAVEDIGDITDMSYRVGKKDAGHRLDGIEHMEFPEGMNE